jgi:hypothetical protein
MYIGVMLNTCYSPEGLTILEFSLQFFSKSIQVSNFIKILPVGAELFHEDRQADLHGETDRQM